MQMYQLAWLNRSITDAFTPLFEIMYGIEVICHIGCLILGPVMMYVAYQARPLHRTIRISFANAILRVILGSTARLVLLHHQYFGNTNVPVVTIASCFREAFLNFFNGAMGALTFDRCFATFYWEWYEKESVSTILVFIANDFLLDGISWTNTICLVLEHVSIHTNVIVMSCLLLISALSFVILYRFNLKEFAHIKRGAQVNSYSIARSFQIRENIAVFQMMLRVVMPTVLFNGPAYFFFFMYLLIPADCGFEFVKNFSIAMFDLWISIYAISLLTLMRKEPIFKSTFERLQILSCRRPGTPASNASIRPSSQPEGDIYFKLFHMDMARIDTVM